MSQPRTELERMAAGPVGSDNKIVRHWDASVDKASKTKQNKPAKNLFCYRKESVFHQNV